MEAEQEKDPEEPLEQQICEIIVLPSPEPGELGKENINECIDELANFINAKTAECQQIVSETSVISFTANFVESRIVSTELGTKVVKLYDILEVRKLEDFEKALEKMSQEVNEKAASLINSLRQAFENWELFMKDVDRQLDQIIGPEKAPDLDSTDDIHLVSHNKMFRSGTLLSYLKKSAYEMMFLEIVTSFSTQECYQHVKTMFENLNEFQKLHCDILLLTKRPTQGGSGFLKLIGIPFRILLNEKDSLKQLLAHRRSVVSLAGIRAIHSYAEFACNEHVFDVDKDSFGSGQNKDQANNSFNSETDSSQGMRSLLGSESGCALVDRRGHILYSHVCQGNTDWPSVEVLLEQVKANQNIILKPRDSVIGKNENKAGNKDNKVSPTTAKNTTTSNESDQTVTVYKRKCCAIL